MRHTPEAAATPSRRLTLARLRGGWTLPRVTFVLALAAAAPLFLNPGGEALNNMVLACAYVVMALGLNVIVGYAGLLDLGYVAFFTIGAYTAAYLASGFWGNAGSGHGVALLVGHAFAGRPGLHFNFLLIMLAAIAATAFAGALIGVPTLRLRSEYIAVVTLAFGEIIGQIAANGADINFLGGTLTSGPIGIGPIDPIDLPVVGAFGPFNLRPWYWFGLTLVAVALLVSVNLRNSRLGRAWWALREDAEAAEAAGIPVVRTKLLAYATGAAFGGVAGTFLASYIGSVNSDQFAFSFSIFIFAMVVLGGIGSISGAVCGAIILSVANNYLIRGILFDLPQKLGFSFDLTALVPGFYGATLVTVMLLRPQGLVPARRSQRRPLRG